MYIKIFHDFSLEKNGSIQTSIKAVRYCLLFVHNVRQSQALVFDIIDKEGHVLFSCEDSLALALVLPKNNLTKVQGTCSVHHQPH